MTFASWTWILEVGGPEIQLTSANLVVETNKMTGGYFGVSNFTDSKGFGVHKFEE
ncbi:hypothetical protein [Haloferula sp.]|uniref:hypothetical protein n=1 Tax=Haloferula sp. TaxID=2497595 RepID=UPI003C7460CA